MRRATIITIGIITSLVVFVFVVGVRDSYYMSTTILIKPNTEITATQADHVINNIAQIPQRTSFASELSSSLSTAAQANWNQQIRTTRQEGTGYVAMNIRGTSEEQVRAISVASMRLWVAHIEQLYGAADQVEIKLIESRSHRGSWSHFVLCFTFSLLIGALVGLILLLISNTFSQQAKSETQTTTQRAQQPKTAQESASPAEHKHQEKFTDIPEQIDSSGQSPISEEPTFAGASLKTQPTYVNPTFSQQSQLRIKEERLLVQQQEEDMQKRLQHARAQKRNFIAATAKESTETQDTSVNDLFEIYGHGDQGIGKKMSVAATASAPSNLPVSEPTVQFGDSHDEPSAADTANITKSETRTRKEDHKDREPRHVEIRASSSDLLEKIVDQKSSINAGGDKQATVNLIDQDVAKREPHELMSRQEGGAPMNLPIVGVTGKMTASEIQAEAKEARAAQSENGTTNNVKAIDPNREPTDDELKERLNQLLRGDLKTKE